MKNYYYSKKLKAIIPFDKILLVCELEYSKENIVSLATNVYIKLEGGENEEFRKAYTEWLERENTNNNPK